MHWTGQNEEGTATRCAALAKKCPPVEHRHEDVESSVGTVQIVLLISMKALESGLATDLPSSRGTAGRM